MAVYCVNIGFEIYRDFSGEITVNTIIKKWIFIWVECTEKKIVSLCKHRHVKYDTNTMSFRYDYSCSSWYAGIPQALKNKLQNAQN